MLKNCIEYAKGCQECQRHSGIQHVPASELHSILKPWPFRGWAIDLIGEIKPASSKNQRYILVGIYYFTKCKQLVNYVSKVSLRVRDINMSNVLWAYVYPLTITGP
jgi:hypothetical protein